MRDAASLKIEDLVASFVDNLDALGRSSHYVKVTGVRLRRLAHECGWERLGDISSYSFQKWRANQKHAAKTLNDYLAAARGFIKWLVIQDMLRLDPLESVKKVSTAGKRARKRRAFTTEEVARLLAVTPVERRRFYMAGYYTGLRRSELEALQWGDLHLDAAPPHVEVRPDTTKNSKEATIAIHPKLMSELLAMRPRRVAANAPIFGRVIDHTGHKLNLFKRDLKAAGIEYRDAQGRVADFHALSRHTPCTHLGQLGISQRVVQEFMRHSEGRLTSAIYTDPDLLPTTAAIMSLPSFADDAQIYAQRLDTEGHEEAPPCTLDWVI